MPSINLEQFNYQGIDPIMEKPGEVEKFKPTHPVVFVVPCKQAEELSGLDLKGSLTVLQVLLALHLSKTPYDLVLASECTHENFETGCFLYLCRRVIYQ